MSRVWVAEMIEITGHTVDDTAKRAREARQAARRVRHPGAREALLKLASLYEARTHISVHHDDEGQND